ncbi:hypothetical protein MUP77_04985 [Candidatus Bathyarchaeota archaeon]|nr:hypothetical protein [Candidatus Bathyarchaeota archaeon]
MKKLERKYPIEYALTPKSVDRGVNWLTLKIRNIGAEALRGLDVRLHSTDTFCLSVYGVGDYIADLEPNEEEEVVIRVSVSGSANMYFTISSHVNGDHFWWESPWLYVNMVEQKAELERLFVLSEPYTSIGKTIKVEATIRGLVTSSGLDLMFWAYTPSGKSEELARIEMRGLSEGEEAKYSTDFTPEETGLYTVYAYLYDEWERIGYRTDTVYVQR